MRLFILILAVIFYTQVSAAVSTHEIEQRIKPIGSVRISPEPIAQASPKAPLLEDTGAHTYQQYCVVCHASGLAGAPIAHDRAQWEARLAVKKINELTASAVKGLNAMPAKGTCSTCSDVQLQQAIEYMIAP